MSVIARRRNGTLTVHNLGQDTVTAVRAVGVGTITSSLAPGASARKTGCESVQHVLYADASGAQQRVGVSDEG